MPAPLDASVLPAGVRSRFLPGVGREVHVLEAGAAERPLILLLHGFPELAFSWRHLMPPLAEAGYHVVAPDARGYGRTPGGGSFGIWDLVRDAAGVLASLGRDHAALVAGHDSGAVTAAACALARPDRFRRLALMSAPFAGPPGPLADPVPPDPDGGLAALDPPRKHYQWYFATDAAVGDMDRPPGGIGPFLRAYFHCKSADWAGNAPHELPDGSAASLALLPAYYVMPKGATMPEAVAPFAPSGEAAWLTDRELAVYAGEYGRTGFGGGMNWYRQRTGGQLGRDLQLFAGQRIAVPSCFYAGAADWGTFQTHGAFAAMRERACADMREAALLPGAGHWVQQEQPAALAARLLAFLR